MSVDVVTFGCRLNAAEADGIRAAARAAGCEDTVVINTCAVTSEAVRKARTAIRRLRHERPKARIVVTGCAAELTPARFAAMPEVALVLGNAAKGEAKSYAAVADSRAPVPPVAEGALVQPRAFVPVQNGCDHRCTFCIIPFARGPSRSVPLRDAVESVRTAVARGAREVVLTGVDLTAYGADLPGRPGLGRLVGQILAFVPELPRLRLSSLDCSEVDEELLDLIARAPRLMPHLHLSLQSGDATILKRMKRRHSREDAIAFCARLRALRPDIALGADLIAGFPTETGAMFENTLSLVDECGLAYLHVFPFSAREGTPAARMPQVDTRAIRERARRLRAKGAEALARHLSRHAGRVLEVMAEGQGLGRAPDYAQVKIRRGAPGEFLSVRIAGHDGGRLLAA